MAGRFSIRGLVLTLLLAVGCQRPLPDFAQTVKPGHSAPTAQTAGHAGHDAAHPADPAKSHATPASAPRDGGWSPIPIPTAVPNGRDAFPPPVDQPTPQPIPGVPNPASASGREYMLCFWNVENFFDDHDDGRTGQGDKEYDQWMARDPEILKLKLSKLADAILSMNGGKGPDILALAEVETLRAAQLLQQTLNARIPNPNLQYASVLMKEVRIGRHIAPAILTRLPVVGDRTRHLGTSGQRILEAHIVVDGKELIVIASHWTSRLRPENVKQRGEYGEKIYGECNAIWHANRSADILVCGDFNDNPTDASVVQGLRATGDLSLVRNGPNLTLFNLMANKDPNGGFGTHYDRGWNIFDQIVVSPGMLDGYGWSVDPASIQVANYLTQPGDRYHRPWRFGNEKDRGPRGYSDHFPVMVKLQVRP